MLITLIAALALQTTHQNKRVIFVMRDERPCTFVILEGVSQADPAAPGSE